MDGHPPSRYVVDVLTEALRLALSVSTDPEYVALIVAVILQEDGWHLGRTEYES